jgi:hypothetical protein
VLLAYTVTLNSEETLVSRASGSVRVGYKELCKHLPAQNFFPCLCKTLESLFNVLHSHYGMMRWLQQRARELELEAAEAALRDDGGERAATAEGAMASRAEDGAVSAESGGGTGGEQARQVLVCTAEAMRRSVRTVWEMMVMRVGALLNASAAPDGAHFLQVRLGVPPPCAAAVFVSAAVRWRTRTSLVRTVWGSALRLLPELNTWGQVGVRTPSAGCVGARPSRASFGMPRAAATL